MFHFVYPWYLHFKGVVAAEASFFAAASVLIASKMCQMSTVWCTPLTESHKHEAMPGL